MNLIIDQGNTATKVYLFEQNKIVKKKTWEKSALKETQDYLYQILSEIDAVLISSVTNDRIEIKDRPTIRMDELTVIPIQNHYETPATLGRDRLANAVGCWAKNPNKASLCIDLGTCIKYDLVSEKGVYLGGNISPGLKMRYKSLNDYTDKLPLIDPEEMDYTYGTTTKTSIQNGVQQAIVHEINGFIGRYQHQFGQLTIFMTGGDLKYFDKGQKNTIFAHSIIIEAELTAFGLNEILSYNVKNAK